VGRVIIRPVFLAGIMVGAAYLIKTAVGAKPVWALGVASMSVCLYFLAVWRLPFLPASMKQKMAQMVKR
jgi:hypothetical protein